MERGYRGRSTPGPWLLEAEVRPDGSVLYSGVWGAPVEEGELNANVHLMQAAPEMLGALVEVERYLGVVEALAKHEEVSRVRSVVAAAISRAECW